MERVRADIQQQAVGIGSERLEERQRFLVSGNVMVLHGHPGDGKTTFCKKAVYAHCKEGWLAKAPNVFRFSLNPSESDIMQGGNLDLEKAFCMEAEGDRILFSVKRLKESGSSAGTISHERMDMMNIATISLLG